MRSCVSEPTRGLRRWLRNGGPTRGVRHSPSRPRQAGSAPTAHAWRILERSFAHLYETGRMRRTLLRGHSNILRRLLIHAGGFNLGRLQRPWLGSEGLAAGPSDSLLAFW